MLIANAVSQLHSRFPIAANDQAKPGLLGLFSQQPLETFARGETVCRDGDPATHVFKIVDGIVRVAKILSDGNRVITGFVYPGEIFGISTDEYYVSDTEAITAVKLRRLNRNRFREAVDSSEHLRPQFINWLCQEMTGAQARTILLARKNAEGRICDLLLALAQRAGRDNGQSKTIEIPMSRADMADYLGLTIETVSRTMTNLIKRGVIQSIERYRFTIRRPALLRSLAEGGDKYDDLHGIPPSRQAMRAH